MANISDFRYLQWCPVRVVQGGMCAVDATPSALYFHTPPLRYDLYLAPVRNFPERMLAQMWIGISCAACTYSSLNVVLVLFFIQNKLCRKDQSKRPAPFLSALEISHSNHQQGFARGDIEINGNFYFCYSTCSFSITEMTSCNLTGIRTSQTRLFLVDYTALTTLASNQKPCYVLVSI